MNILSRSGSALIIAVALLSNGCDDATAGKATAEVSSAKAVSSGDKAGGAKFEVAAADSKLGFVGSKVTGSHDGGFKKFSGSANLADGKIEGGSVEVEIDMSSTFSDSEKLTGHLKSPDFFDVAKHKTAKFVSTSIEKGGDGGTHTVTGNLTLRGETKSIKFPANIELKGDAITVKSEFTINRMDYGIEYKGMADDLIKKEVVIKLDLKLKKA